ncbi:response regulator [Rhodococcus sp. BP-252]|uniref:Transcriptional regulatory protein n=1 Tax=Rhodococcoides kyotonense TaxID=398843 RepID=A0A177YGB5_9NOCA|nr:MULTISPECIES: response regulator [Rhodococcus]MBY6412766.1 response regulator [Rhodococcus sp. BP-320]MBY6417436.1 response regulator [Rhodococcus sp. BP-321]MBY6421786.1 response regulator [Rhodococcus sp. BP-324]MBY6427525.1 response regulator [Rhodococcus sp. BP-323]MBY6432624.1 response regulator [Rhodococcus sp. BP-322]
MIRVLIVEDEVLIAEAHKNYVERVPGFTVVGMAHTGQAALKAATEAEEPVDLVLLDIGLPDSNGIDVAAALGGLRPSPDVIAITSERDLSVVRSAVAHGVVLYLLKPFTFAAFRDKLERYREFHDALPAGENAASQRDIDRAMSRLRTADERASSPKGIAPQTMDGVTAIVRDAPGGLNASEAAKLVGVSRVTAWRYLERLADDGLVTRNTEYGRAGRPQVRYVWR